MYSIYYADIESYKDAWVSERQNLCSFFFGNQVLQQSVVCMSMKLSTKMVKFMAHGSMVLALGCGQYDNIVKLC